MDLPDDCIFKKSMLVVTDGVEPPAINARPLPLCVVSPFGSVKKF